MSRQRLTNFRPALYLAAGTAAGIAAAFFLPIGLRAALIVLFAAALVLFICKKKTGAAIFCAAVLAGAAAADIFVALFPDRSVQGLISGRITDASVCDDEGMLMAREGVFVLQLDKLSADGVQLSGKGSLELSLRAPANLKVGDTLVFYGSAGASEFSPDAYSSLNAAKYRIYYEIVCFEPQNISVISGSPSAVENVRLAFKKTIFDNCSTGTASFLYAMIFGDVAYMSEDVAQPFRDTGTAHLFAVSGLHVALLFYACTALLDKIKMPQLARFAGGAFIMVGYCALCSFSPSVVRSAVMIMTAEVCKPLRVRYEPLSAMGFSAAVLLLCAPYFLLDAGFLMSYGAVAGILCAYKPLLGVLQKVLWKPIAEAVAISVASNLGLLPLMFAYFGTISLLTVPVNLVVVPLTSLFYPFLLASLAIAVVLPPLGGLLTLLSVPTYISVLFVQAAAKVSSAAFNAVFSPLLCVFYYPLFACASVYCRAPAAVKRTCGVLCLCICAAACLVTLPV